ncbi:hypothetical protein HID58_035525, partial [Brassica napus]
GRDGGFSASAKRYHLGKELLSFASDNFLPLALVTGVGLGFKLSCFRRKKMSRFFAREEIQEVQGTHINNRTMVGIISGLPSEMRRHLLSFLPIRVAALTSSLSRDWRDEFCMTPTLKLRLDDDTDDMIPFISFVNRIVSIRGPDGDRSPLRKFHLTLHRVIDRHEADQGNLLFESANEWINFSLAKGVTILTLCFYQLPHQYDGLPEAIFVASSLVKLHIATSHHATLFPSTVSVLLPCLKSLRLDMVGLGDDGQGFYTLLSGCPIIEELEMKDLAWFAWSSSSVCSSTLKVLSICWDFYAHEDERHQRPASVSFVTPNLLYLDYNDDTAGDYKALDFASLVEAEVRLHLRVEQGDGSDSDEDEDELEIPQQEDASDFFKAICNVQKLLLHADTLQVLAFGCLTIHPFPNLTELIIESYHHDQLSDWDSVPLLLNNCPQLHTLVFMGLTHQPKNTCGNVCRCEGGVVPAHSCLQASPVKVLKIYDVGQAALEMDRFIGMVRHFLVTMPHLESFLVYCDGSAETRMNLSRGIRRIQGKASPMCRIQV